jgi:hypothetical protein
MIKYNNNFRTQIHLNRYFNGQLAVFILGYKSEPIAELSIMNDSVKLAPNEFILKDYSENKDLISDILKFETFTPTNRFVLVGSHLCPICQIAA